MTESSERLWEPEEQAINYNIVFPRCDRNDTSMILQHSDCISNTNIITTLIDMWMRKFHKVPPQDEVLCVINGC